MIKKLIIVAATVLVLTAAAWGISAAVEKPVDPGSASFYQDCMSKASAEEKAELAKLANDDGIVYKRAALEIIGQIEKGHRRVTGADAESIEARGLSVQLKIALYNEIAGAPDMQRDGSGMDTVVYNMDDLGNRRLVLLNGIAIFESKNADGSYSRTDANGNPLQPIPSSACE